MYTVYFHKVQGVGSILGILLPFQKQCPCAGCRVIIVIWLSYVTYVYVCTIKIHYVPMLGLASVNWSKWSLVLSLLCHVHVFCAPAKQRVKVLQDHITGAECWSPLPPCSHTAASGYNESMTVTTICCEGRNHAVAFLSNSNGNSSENEFVANNARNLLYEASYYSLILCTTHLLYGDRRTHVHLFLHLR